jgi:hypothetical protein
MKEITKKIENGFLAGDLLKTKESIKNWIEYILPNIGFYFNTTLGFPFEEFCEEIESKTVPEQLLFCVTQVKLGNYE